LYIWLGSSPFCRTYDIRKIHLFEKRSFLFALVT